MTLRELLGNDTIDRHLMVVVYERNENNEFERKCAYSRHHFDSEEEYLLKKHGKANVVDYELHKHYLLVRLGR